jgi:hypothetical protein
MARLFDSCLNIPHSAIKRNEMSALLGTSLDVEIIVIAIRPDPKKLFTTKGEFSGKTLMGEFCHEEVEVHRGTDRICIEASRIGNIRPSVAGMSIKTYTFSLFLSVYR